jgi:hypothetical protein
MSEQEAVERVADYAAYTVQEFCISHRISRSALYKLWADGQGPRRFQIGSGRSSKILISTEAAKDWRRSMEKSAA